MPTSRFEVHAASYLRAAVVMPTWQHFGSVLPNDMEKSCELLKIMYFESKNQGTSLPRLILPRACLTTDLSIWNQRYKLAAIL